MVHKMFIFIIDMNKGILLQWRFLPNQMAIKDFAAKKWRFYNHNETYGWHFYVYIFLKGIFYVH